jgi:hypothetical protein
VKRLNNSVKNALYLLLCAQLTLLVALRGDTRDTFNYLEVYRGLDSFPWSPAEFQDKYFMEWGFGILVSLTKQLAIPPEGLFFIVSALTFLAIAKASKRLGLEPWSTLPFYLCTFFLTQQFMQIRQGLAVAIAFWTISIIIQRPQSWLKAAILTLAGVLFHLVSIVPIAVAIIITRITPAHRNYKNYYWVATIFGTIIGACWLASSTDLFALTNRISNYIGDENFGSARSIAEPANLRAIILTLAFITLRPSADRPWFKAYMMLLGLFIAHLGIRIGFIDIAILSGRIGSALGFSEIFLLPLLIKDQINSRRWRIVLTTSYMLLHLSISLLISVPYLIEDYFRPI